MTTHPKTGDFPTTDRQGWPWAEPDVGTGVPSKASVGGAEAAADWPKISIVVTSFEQGDFLEETLRSILLQGYPNLEVLVIDGGSHDGSVAVLEAYDPWLSFWVSEADRGQSDAINKGFARATGDIITFLASDDVYQPGVLFDVASRWLESPDCGVIAGAFRFMDEMSRREPEVHAVRFPEPGPHDLSLMDTSLWRIHQVSTFYTRRALDEVGRNVRLDLDYTMDRELLYRVCRKFPVVLSDEVYASFRRHATSKSTTRILPMMREMADLHWLDAPPDEAPDRQRLRRALWRERLGRGYEKLARSGAPRAVALWALLRAPWADPSILCRRRYFSTWLSLLGLRPLALRLASGLDLRRLT